MPCVYFPIAHIVTTNHTRNMANTGLRTELSSHIPNRSSNVSQCVGTRSHHSSSARLRWLGPTAAAVVRLLALPLRATWQGRGVTLRVCVPGNKTGYETAAAVLDHLTEPVYLLRRVRRDAHGALTCISHQHCAVKSLTCQAGAEAGAGAEAEAKPLQKRWFKYLKFRG